MKKRSENLRAEISQYTGWDIASGITSVPVTDLDKIMRDGQNWLPEIYTQILRRADQREIAQHFWADVKDPSSSKGLVRESASQWREIAYEEENKLTRDFLCYMHIPARCYIWSAPVGAIGMCIWGPGGFGIALAGNAVFWIVLSWLQSGRQGSLTFCKRFSYPHSQANPPSVHPPFNYQHDFLSRNCDCVLLISKIVVMPPCLAGIVAITIRIKGLWLFYE